MTEITNYSPNRNTLLELVQIDYPEIQEINMSEQACNYLVSRMMGNDHPKAMSDAKAMPIAIMLWQKDPEFMSIYNQIKQAEAMMLESVVWDQAMNNPKASIERMFALKSRMSEYKDNAVATGQTVTNVRISIDGQDFDVSASMKDRGELNNG